MRTSTDIQESKSNLQQTSKCLCVIGRRPEYANITIHMSIRKWFYFIKY